VRAKAIFVGGTASHAGKSWLTTAICRYLRKRGHRVAPFKAQNMSNNSFPCADGGEIGRAQVAQAEACDLEPEPDMNPVLLKPTSNLGSQVIVNGKLWKNLSSTDYYGHTAFLRTAALDAYERLAQRFDYVVIEGAGSVAELNLKSRDFVNLSMARAAGAGALLVSDIDRGGIFASIIGTLGLLDPEERQLVRAFAVNRFRGNRALFSDGVQILEEKSGCPSLGVFPFLEGATLQQEDSVSLDDAVSDPGASIAILRLPRISNFTDFRLLRATWISRPVERDFQWVILPGTKNTIGDLEWLRQSGLDAWIRRQHEHGAKVLGVCGGFQMLGRTIEDPEGMESGSPSVAEGLGLLPVRTVLESAKVVRTVRARVGGVEAGGYEIHLGRTDVERVLPAFAELPDGRTDGVVDGRVMGTYLHGVLEHEAVARSLFGECRESARNTYDELACWFERNANLKLFGELFL
jgi:adenosylcobyric acid synthase